MKDNIYIKIDEEYLDLQDDISVQFVLNSPLFDDDVLKGDYTYPFSLHLKSQKNRKLTGRPDDVKNSYALKNRIDCTLGLLGKEYDSYLKIISAERDNKVTVAVFVKDSKLVKSKETSIRSFDYGSVNLEITGQYKEVHFSWNRDGGAPTYQPLNIQYLAINGFIYFADYITGHASGDLMSGADYEATLDLIILRINADTSNNKVVASRSPVYSNQYWGPYFGIKLVSTIQGKYAPLYLSDNWSTYNPKWLEMRYNNEVDTGEVMINYMNEVVKGINGEKRFIFAPLYFEQLYTNLDFEHRNDLKVNFIGPASYEFDHYVNEWNANDNSFRRNRITNPNTTSVIPLPFLKHIVYTLFEKIGYKVQGSFFKDEELSRLVFYNTATLDRLQSLTWLAPVYYPPYHYYRIPTNVFDDKIIISNHIPDITISKLISLIRKTFGCYVIFNSDSKDLIIGLLIDVINDPEVIDWSNKTLAFEKLIPREQTGVTLKYTNDPTDFALKDIVPSINGFKIKTPVASAVDLPKLENQENDLRLVLNENAYYIATFENKLGDIIWEWNFYSLNVYDFVYKGGSLQIDSGNSLTLMVKKGGVELPYFNQLAKTSAYNQINQEFTPRLMIYRGFKTFTVDNSGMTATFPTISRTADALDKYSLEWDGEKGLFNKFYAPWLEFITNAVPVEKQLDLNKSEIANLKWDKFYRMEGVNYLISQIKFTVQKNKISTVSANMYAKT